MDSNNSLRSFPDQNSFSNDLLAYLIRFKLKYLSKITIQEIIETNNNKTITAWTIRLAWRNNSITENSFILIFQ